MQDYFINFGTTKGYVRILGKKELGEEGFEFDTKKICEEGVHGSRWYKKYVEENLKKIETEANLKTKPKKSLVMTSMTKIDDIEYLDKGVYLPSIITWKKEYSSIFDPKKILEYSKDEDFVPVSDFIVFRECDDLVVGTLSKAAPVLLFTTLSTRWMCIGTVLREALLTHLDYIFSKIFKALTVNEANKVRLDIVTCTGNKLYDDEFGKGSIYSSILKQIGESKCADCISEIHYMYKIEENEEFYNDSDLGSNVILVTFTK